MKLTDRRKATVVGVLILVAYAVLANAVTSLKMVVTPAEIVSGVAVIGIAVLMFPLFTHRDKHLANQYLLTKIIEGALLIIAGILFFFPYFAVYDLRAVVYLVQTYAFIVSAFIFYVLLYKTKIIPRFISIWGIVAAILLLAANVLEATGLTIPIVILVIGYVPIMFNEVFLAIWLISKGFTHENLES